MTIRLLPFLLFTGLLSGVAAAAPAPQEVVQSTSEEVRAAIKAERAQVEANPKRAHELINKIVAPHFDFDRMSSWVLGKYWRTATPAQRQRFMEEFRTLLVRTYARAVVDNVDAQIRYLPLNMPSAASEVTVRTEIPQKGGFPIEINYSFYQKDGVWKVFDVTIDGISLVTNYRTSFATEIRQGGMDQLLAKLASRNNKSTNE